MSALVVVADLAAQINSEHALAQQTADTAVQHAIRCGQLLLSAKADLKHGEFMLWIETNCSFRRSTASRYMKAALQISTGVEISSLRTLFNKTTSGTAGRIRSYDNRKMVSATLKQTVWSVRQAATALARADRLVEVDRVPLKQIKRMRKTLAAAAQKLADATQELDRLEFECEAATCTEQEVDA